MDHNYFQEGGKPVTTNLSSEETVMYEDNTNFDESFNEILLIEDNPGDARLVELLLGESDLLNCKITNKTTLSDGIAALEDGGDYAAILLDLTLPDSRGFETLERLLAKFPDNNVIVLTGLSDKSLGINAVKAGAQDFLIKGAFDADLLAKSLRYSIERSSVLKRLEETQRIASIGNWEFNNDSGEFTASDAVFNIFGLPPRKTIVHQEEINDPTSSLHVFVKIHEQTVVERRIKKDIKVKNINGETRYAFIQCQANRNAENNIILTGIIQDITERKLAEQEVAKSQERYQDIFTKSKDAIYICGMDGKVIDFNQATLQLFDYDKEAFSDLNVHTLLNVVDSEESFINTLTARRAIKDLEVEIERRDGNTKYCLITANLTESGEFDGYNAIVRDITEQKQAERLRKARDLAQQSAAMKEQFIASISHEMRTPMNAVLGMSNLLIKTKLDEEQFGYINSVKQSSEILLGIINDILEISTIQNGKIEFEYKDFDLHELMDNLINVMQYKMKEKDLIINLAIDPSVPQFIKGDKLRLNQILYNLVGNAVKFTDKGFVNIKVKTIIESGTTAQLKFEVEDSGIGIPPDKCEAIFETFTRIRQKERLYEGTGLGLSIAKNLVEQQGGKIGVVSDYGHGSTFYFDIIFEIGNEAEANVKIEGEQFTMDPARAFRLLLVEDHKMNQLVARKTLERQYENIDLTIADNGQIAVDILKKETFDIVLMDIQMPVMDGYETTQYIRNEMPPEIASLPILAMTAHAHISKDEKFKELGMDDFVLKPFEPEQLFNKIAKYIKKDTVMTDNAYQYVNLDYLELMSDGDLGMKKIMLEMLLQELPEELQKMKEIQQVANWDELSSVSHKMKSTLAFVGNDIMTDANKQLEKISKTKENTELTEGLIDQLREMYDKVVIELQRELASL